MALSAYRNLLRSIQIAFQGDTRLLTSALGTARSNFDSSRSLPQQSPEASAAIQHAKEVASVLRTNVVQGREVDGKEGGKFQLRIHEDIERGSNETVKLARGQATLEQGVSGGCCGGADIR